MAQRTGRAGRVQNGICWRLFEDDPSFLEHTVPEVARVSVDDLVLQTCLVNENVGAGVTDVSLELEKLIEPPPARAVHLCCRQLVEIGAMTSLSASLHRLSPLGYHLSQMPMDCRVGKLLLTGCLLGCLEPALIVAASLSAPKSMIMCVRATQRRASAASAKLS
jgi:HrpA-like RNA helicase